MTKQMYKTCSKQKTAASLNYTGIFVAAVVYRGPFVMVV